MSQAAREVETELAGDAAQRAATTTTPEVEDDIAAALARNTVVGRLRTKLAAAPYNWPASDIDKFADDFTDNADALAKFESGALDVEAWKKLSSNADWVRKNAELFEKLKGKDDVFLQKINDYYSVAMKRSTPSGFNGAGIYDGILIARPSLFIARASRSCFLLSGLWPAAGSRSIVSTSGTLAL